MITLTTTVVARIACVIAVVLALVALLVQDHASAPTASQASPTPTAEPPRDPPPLRPEPEEVAAARKVEDRVRARLREVSQRAHVAVSLRDEESKDTFNYGSDRFPTASAVKIHFVALMSWRAEQSGAGLTATQRQDIEQMLVRSENDPANRAYTALGGPAGVEQGLERAFGSSRIEVGEQFRWGHSMTRPRAVVALLREVLDTDHREYALMQDAMARVVPELRWGIPVLADPGTAAQVKVGFVQDPDGWVVNSSGRVIVDDSPVLISVMSDRNATLESGIATVEEVARLVEDVVRAERAKRKAQQRALPLLSLLRRSAAHVA
ncbi:MAG: hypothetical protein WAL70_07675 [Aeromicrobium sp.]